jgi:hypothetical protein
MAFTYRAGELSLQLRHSDKRILGFEDDSAREVLFRSTDGVRGKWNDFVVQARWSYETNGLVNVWLNGEQIVQYRGPVGYNDDVGPYFRFGLYRGDTDQTYVARFRQVRSGTSAEEIGFAPDN